MSFAMTLFQRPASDYPGNDDSPAPASRAKVLIALLVACFVLRALMSLTWDVLWSDGVVYLKTCQFLEQGDFDNAFKGLGLNTYPVILLIFRRLGLEWSTAAVWWSVLMASLTVLPLYGWIRRQFDDQIATLACILYALHPKLLGFSPLTIRDPTFWFLFILTLYVLWRAATEARLWLFALGGILLALASLTRIEGWLLLVPLILWPAGRVFSVPMKEKGRLALGTLLALSTLPLLLLVVNVTLLRNHSRWELGHNHCINHAVSFLQRFNLAGDDGADEAPKAPRKAPRRENAAMAPPSEKAAAKTNKPAAVPVQAETEEKSAISRTVELIGKVGSRLVKAFTYAFGLLVLIGLFFWRHIFMRWEHQAILVMNTLLLVAIGMRQSLDGIDVRYYLPIVIVGFSFMALGLLWLVQAVSRLLFGEDGATSGRRAAVGAGLLVVVAAVGSLNVFPVSRPTMYEHAYLGRWILDNYGPEQKVLASRGKQTLVEYYSQGQMLSGSRSAKHSSNPLIPLLESKVPDVVLLWREERYGERWNACAEEVLAQQERLGYEEIPREQLPERCENVKVLVRVDKRP